MFRAKARKVGPMNIEQHGENRRREEDRIKLFKKAEEHLCWNTIQDLRELLKMAESGELIGITYVAIKRRFDYAIGITGAAMNHPEMANGCLSQLSFRLNQIAHSKR